MAVDRRATRLGVLAVVGVLLMSAIGVRLWFLQTVRAEDLQESVTISKTRTVALLPERGRIFDADGRILADNERILTVAVDYQLLRNSRDREEIFRRLSGWIDVPIEEMEARYDSGRYSPFLPMPVKEDVDERTAAAIRERSEDFPGVEIITEWRRVYPYAPLASHVVGYMGAITAEQLDEYLDAGYARSERVGQFGVELTMEEFLHGKWGRRVYEVDAANRPVRTVEYVPPINGYDIQLSIDLDVQQYAEQSLQSQLENRREFEAKNPYDPKTDEFAFPEFPEFVPYKAPAGSSVILDHDNGQVLAMASYPTFDNRWFNAGISGDKFQQLFPPTDDPDRSILVNRAVQGRYNLGSTFKPFVAYAALREGLLTPDETYNDTGTYQVESIDADVCASGVRCEFRNAICGNGLPCVYGEVNAQLSIAVSSDTFYYRLGELFYLQDRTLMQDRIREFGFGADTGIDLPFEYDGRVPDDASKKALVDAGVLAEGEEDRLLVGDNLQTAIGQGLLAATPLQLAVGYATFANGGFVYSPHVVTAIYEPGVPDAAEPGFVDLSEGKIVENRTRPELIRQIPMTPELRGPIDAGLRQNVTGPGANGRSTTAEELFDIGYPDRAIQVGGKTGTAQGQGNYPWTDSSVFAAYSIEPEHPYTAVTYLEKAGFGSQGAAPVVKCNFLMLSGELALDPVRLSDPLDVTSRQVAEPQSMPNEICLNSSILAANYRPVD